MKMKRRDPDKLPTLVSSFFLQHLRQVRGASAHTVRAYRDTLRLYLNFTADVLRRGVADVRLVDFDVEHVTDFLRHLEDQRSNAIGTRNCRLAALKSFFRHLIRNDPERSEQYHRVLALPSKRARLRPASYLEPEQVRSILSKPDQRTRRGARDYTLLLFMYNTGARVAEVLKLCIQDMELTRPVMVRLHGKGNRDRLCPIWRDTVVAVRRLAALVNHLSNEKYRTQTRLSPAVDQHFH